MAQNYKAGSWFNPLDSRPFDPTNFNYDSEASRVLSQQALAKSLLGQAMTPNKGQFFSNAYFTGFGGGNTLGSALAQGLVGALSGQLNNGALDAQDELAQRQQQKIQYELGEKDPQRLAAERAAVDQQTREAMAEMLRESRRDPYNGTQPIAPPPAYSPAQDSQAANVATSYPVAPQTPPNAAPLAPVNKAVVAKQIMQSAPSFNAGKDSQAAYAAMPNKGLPKGPSTGDNLTASDITSNFGRIGDIVKGNAKSAWDFLTGYDPKPLQQSISGAFSPSAPAPAPVQAPVAAPQTPAPTPAATPPVSAPVAAPMPTPAPVPAPVAAPVAQAPAQAVDPASQVTPQQQKIIEAVNAYQAAGGTGPIGDPRSAVDQARANAQPSQADIWNQVIGLNNAGPIGQQMANTIMQRMMPDYDYKIIKNQDGSESVFAVNKRNPAQSGLVYQNGGSGNSPVTGQTTDAEGNRWNVHKDGSVTPMTPAGGEQLKDSTVVAKNTEMETKKRDTAQAAQNAVDASEFAASKAQDLLRPMPGGGTYIGNATGFWANKKDTFGNLIGMPTDVATARADLESFKSTLALAALRAMKAVGNGASGMGGISDKEGQLLQSDIAALDPEKMNAETITRNLNSIITRLNDLKQRQLQFAPGKPVPEVSSRQPGAAPGQISYGDFKN